MSTVLCIKSLPWQFSLNFQIVACAVAVGILLHAGNHLLCDFPRLVNSSPEKFALIAHDFNNKRPNYKDLLTGVEGVTGISMVILLIIAFTLATRYFRRNLVKLPAPFNRLTGFNAFWFSHHLTALVYVLLFIHGSFLFLVHNSGCRIYSHFVSTHLTHTYYLPSCKLQLILLSINALDIKYISQLPYTRNKHMLSI